MLHRKENPFPNCAFSLHFILFQNTFQVGWKFSVELWLVGSTYGHLISKWFDVWLLKRYIRKKNKNSGKIIAINCIEVIELNCLGKTVTLDDNILLSPLNCLKASVEHEVYWTNKRLGLIWPALYPYAITTNWFYSRWPATSLSATWSSVICDQGRWETSVFCFLSNFLYLITVDQLLTRNKRISVVRPDEQLAKAIRCVCLTLIKISNQFQRNRRYSEMILSQYCGISTSRHVLPCNITPLVSRPDYEAFQTNRTIISHDRTTVGAPLSCVVITTHA